MLTDKNLVKEIAPHLEDGVQRIYRYADGHGLSLVNATIVHSYPFAWNAAVIHFPDKDSDEFEIVYDTELTDAVAIFNTDEDTNAFIERAAALFDVNV